MYYIVGLGNTGDKYSDTRHNVGWMILDYCLDKFSFSNPVSSKVYVGKISGGVIDGKEISILYPETYMNNSGNAVVKFVPETEYKNLIVIHDDVDLPFGDIKIGFGRGAGGNNGVKSIIDKLKTKDFIRVRVGIASKNPETGEIKRPQSGGSLEKFVLKPFTLTEQKQLLDIFNKVKNCLEVIVTEGIEMAMNKCN